MRLMMPKKSEEKDNWNGNAEQPQQHAFTKVHGSLLVSIVLRTRF
jgi:hypothetical protein